MLAPKSYNRHFLVWYLMLFILFYFCCCLNCLLKKTYRGYKGKTFLLLNFIVRFLSFDGKGDMMRQMSSCFYRNFFFFSVETSQGKKSVFFWRFFVVVVFLWNRESERAYIRGTIDRFFCCIEGNGDDVSQWDGHGIK